MRYVYDKPTDLERIDASTNLDFFRKARRSLGDAADSAVLLVGGSDRRSLAVRHAQSVLRFDRRPSKWSHAAVVLRWSANGDDLIGLEVSGHPEHPDQQVPERNGVTTFSLSKYADRKRYPNLCVIGWTSDRLDRVDAEARIRTAVSHPCSNLVRYPLWDSLSRWAGYSYASETSKNPLLDGFAEPSAAFCEYAFAGAGIDLTPVAIRNDIAPEHLWATARRIGEGSGPVAFHGCAVVRDEHALPLPALSSVIDLRRFR